MTIGTSILLIAIGAILRWAVTATISGFNIQTAGTVLLIVGVIGLILSIIYTFAWSRRETVVYDDPRSTRRPPPPPDYY
jgi:Zn-dependent protease with chaperone function